MRWQVLILASLAVAGCNGGGAGGDDGTYVYGYMDAHKDEGADRVVVDGMETPRTWNYIEVKASKVTVHVAINGQATRTNHDAVLGTANSAVLLDAPDTMDIEVSDYLSFCGMPGSSGAAISSVMVTVSDSGSHDDLVTTTFSQIAACA